MVDRYDVDDEGNVDRFLDGAYVYFEDYEALEAKLETEKDHSKFFGELLQALYGDKWETLTIHEAKKHKAKLAALVEAANFKRNAIIRDSSEFIGNWVAIPEDDFDKLVAAIAAAKDVTP